MCEQGAQDIRAFTTPPGGIMTQEVGAITGPVEAWLEADRVRIRYVGALDTYTVRGTVSGRTMDEVERVLTTDPGVDEYGNPSTVELTEPAVG